MTAHNQDKNQDSRSFNLEPVDRERLAFLVGPEDENIKHIAKRLGVEILNMGASFTINGKAKPALAAERIIKQLYLETAPLGKHRKPQYITPDKVNLTIIEHTHLEADEASSPDPLDFYSPEQALAQAENARAYLRADADAANAAAAANNHGNGSGNGNGNAPAHENADPEVRGSIGELYHKAATLKSQRGIIKARTPNQAHYISQIISHDVSFGIGPAGTGKTFLAVAAAVDALTRNEIRRIILTRPAVEAGEKLGFLPGDLTQKVDPYLRPLYDALFEMLGFEKVEKLIERQVIEIAPLAYMRGRTLNDSFIILDEAQNTTIEQMKMFLTRIGFNSKAVITGDPSQVDLPRNIRSGLKHAMEVLANVNSIAFTYFESGDVVRHPVVAAIVNAYAAYEQKEQDQAQARRAEQEHENERRYYNNHNYYRHDSNGRDYSPRYRDEREERNNNEAEAPLKSANAPETANAPALATEPQTSDHAAMPNAADTPAPAPATVTATATTEPQA